MGGVMTGVEFIRSDPLIIGNTAWGNVIRLMAGFGPIGDGGGRG